MTTCRFFYKTPGFRVWEICCPNSESWNFEISWNFQFSKKTWDKYKQIYTMCWWHVHAYITTTTHMQPLHFAACGFKPFVCLDSICFYTVENLSFVVSQKYIVRITFRETAGNYHSIPSNPHIVCFEEGIWWLPMHPISWRRWMITSDLGIYHHRALEHPWRIIPSSSRG